jgi:hypothetical protein
MLTVKRSLSKVRYLFWRFSQAEDLLRECREASAIALGEHHRTTLLSSYELAMCCWWQGKTDEAEALLMFYLEKQEETLGPYHMETWSSQFTLSLLRILQGRLPKAFHEIQSISRFIKIVTILLLMYLWP